MSDIRHFIIGDLLGQPKLAIPREHGIETMEIYRTTELEAARSAYFRALGNAVDLTIAGEFGPPVVRGKIPNYPPPPPSGSMVG